MTKQTLDIEVSRKVEEIQFLKSFVSVDGGRWIYLRKSREKRGSRCLESNWAAKSNGDS